MKQILLGLMLLSAANISAGKINIANDTNSQMIVTVNRIDGKKVFTTLTVDPSEAKTSADIPVEAIYIEVGAQNGTHKGHGLVLYPRKDKNYAFQVVAVGKNFRVKQRSPENADEIVNGKTPKKHVIIGESKLSTKNF